MTVEFLAKYCGPAVVSSALNISRKEAAKKILEVGTGMRKNSPSVDIHNLATILKKPVRHCSGYMRKPSNPDHQYSMWYMYPMVKTWLKNNSTGEYIIRASHHFMYVKDGEIIEDNGTRPMRGRVTHYIKVK